MPHRSMTKTELLEFKTILLDAKRANALHSYEASLRSSSTTPSSSLALARR